MFFTRALLAVLNTKGGRQWNKPWGRPRLTRTQKANRRKDQQLFQQNIQVLKAAEALQPEVPVRLFKPLPLWQQALMKRKLAEVRAIMNARGDYQ